MNYLLDTHAFIWFSEDDAQLPVDAKLAIEDEENSIYLSIVSLWEMAIKVSLDKLELSKPLEDITREVDRSRIQWLPLTVNQVHQLKMLPFHHRDPFDRTIIAQGLVEQFTIITKDSVFSNYGVSTLWKTR